ncbi:hypothetical protein SUBG_00046 [Sulfitobacter phage pCB2047-C]|uniref:hypothetical protein n=1 Tax=Sulfitobacter phage pCB2047-C TaxID=754043 RepID=UPI0002C14637|nr:hypothetical protein SUBG_00046 [Sulfitobacter phage pCB2047-C]YP_007675427.1 hypothetical protein SUAG_00035 [Sulfitobacter phage pCB2047-A]AGG91216.1 hypothetical protein SUBG_00046 [Sulfitobacter phage pCB2047-C]AGH30761.1 hypothetical protein SUAG_00035 [Sulfitobacter phage pCB2047-A]
MSMIEDIKRDREICTKGKMQIVDAYDEGWSIDTDGENSAVGIGTDLAGAIAIYAVPEAFGMDDELDANVRRALRGPDMEAALIAAEELADAVSALTSRPDSAHGGRLILTVDVNRAEQKLAAYRAATGAA